MKNQFKDSSQNSSYPHFFEHSEHPKISSAIAFPDQNSEKITHEAVKFPQSLLPPNFDQCDKETYLYLIFFFDDEIARE